ncbi:NUDIX domain-containing protein [Patescibacteria group bacterium]|nr:NUDIX domain-containing protein [Patescibacteria group bacterium]
MQEYRSTREWPFHISSGGAVYKDENGQRTYAILFRGERFGKYGNSWHLPKGTLTSEETLEQCALREIREESGLEVAITAYLGAIHDAWHSEKEDRDIDKTTHYFLCRYISGNSSMMDQEHDELQWLPADQAKGKLSLTPKYEALIIERAEKYIDSLQNS